MLGGQPGSRVQLNVLVLLAHKLDEFFAQSSVNPSYKDSPYSLHLSIDFKFIILMFRKIFICLLLATIIVAAP